MSLAVELARLQATPEEVEACEERAAIIEFDGHVPREQAEAAALAILVKDRARRPGGPGGPPVPPVEGLRPVKRRPSGPAAARLLLGDDAVLSPTVAAQWLPGRSERNRAWLHEQQLVHRVGKSDVVIWAEVKERIAAGQRSVQESQQAQRAPRRRSTESTALFAPRRPRPSAP